MNPLFYNQIAGIDSVKDREKKILHGRDALAFCEKSHICPCLVSEFYIACREFPIVFVMENEKLTPVFLLGLKPSQNLFVKDGVWNGIYLPRYLYRYPFIIAEIGNDQKILAIDSNIESASDGMSLFTEDGNQSDFLLTMLRESELYYADAALSDAFMDKIKQLDLIQPISVEITGEGEKYGWTDIYAVDQKKLNDLPDEELIKLVRNGYYSAIQSHIMSLQSFNDLKKKEENYNKLEPQQA